MADDAVPQTFRALVEGAERKFAKVRDAPAYGRGPNHYFPKVFKAYMKLWDYQQKNRSRLVESGLQRWEIGEIASRIGQLYFVQYMRTSEARFLLESYIFYEAILNRGYFEGSSFKALKDRGLRFKELRFYARFLLVALILNRWEMVKLLLDRFKALVDDSKAKFPDTTFKEWKVVMQEMVRFMKVDAAFSNTRPLRYCAMFDSYPNSLPYVARFHAKKVLKLRDALLMSYHRNEVKFAELTTDTFRMLQCLEWEPSGSFYQKQPVESYDNGVSTDQSGTSGLIDINLVADMTDPSLPPNPKKAVLYRPSVIQLLAVLAAICDELPPDSVMLIYIAASGDSGQTTVPHKHISGSVRTSLKLNTVHERSNFMPENLVNGKGGSSHPFESSVWLGPTRSGGSNNLYPGDLIPFTRRPAFFIIDSDNSHSFKVLHGAERGEPAALLLSPLRPTFKNQSGGDIVQNGSQFTLFLTAPLRACWQMFGLAFSDDEVDVMEDAESIVSAAFSEWEVILCTSTSLNLVWAQVLSEPLLRRLILRFIFCRSVLTLFRRQGDNARYLPVCLPELPDSVSPHSEIVQSAVLRLAEHLKVSHYFGFDKL
ncbi:protein SCAI isoform X1 [Cynara cardunculus var. scolymus]|uniref:protein SCAI isoform X1 n=1 Tax=Cynara cardunculus var. scolymus TaxID=59895 RepID=UPI000D625C36|nr:protein SCAI isoform X1 [Cynara cardunculus var. scolymus]